MLGNNFRMTRNLQAPRFSRNESLSWLETTQCSPADCRNPSWMPPFYVPCQLPGIVCKAQAWSIKLLSASMGVRLFQKWARFSKRLPCRLVSLYAHEQEGFPIRRCQKASGTAPANPHGPRRMHDALLVHNLSQLQDRRVPPKNASRHGTPDLPETRATRPKQTPSLPEFMNFKLFGKTILVVNIKFGLFWGHPLGQ